MNLIFSGFACSAVFLRFQTFEAIIHPDISIVCKKSPLFFVTYSANFDMTVSTLQRFGTLLKTSSRGLRKQFNNCFQNNTRQMSRAGLVLIKLTTELAYPPKTCGHKENAEKYSHEDIRLRQGFGGQAPAQRNYLIADYTDYTEFCHCEELSDVAILKNHCYSFSTVPLSTVFPHKYVWCPQISKIYSYLSFLKDIFCELSSSHRKADM